MKAAVYADTRRIEVHQVPDARIEDPGGAAGCVARYTLAPGEVMAGLMCAPLTPPATYTPNATANAQAISSQLEPRQQPEACGAVVRRP